MCFAVSRRSALVVAANRFLVRGDRHSLRVFLGKHLTHILKALQNDGICQPGIVTFVHISGTGVDKFDAVIAE